MMLSLPLLILCVLVLVVVIGLGGFLVLLKLGVIVQEASRPSYQDHNDYSLDQGREVRAEDDDSRAGRT